MAWIACEGIARFCMLASARSGFEHVRESVTGVLVIVVALFVVFVILWVHDNRSMPNAVIFGLLLAFGYVLLLEIAFVAEWGGWLYAWLTLGLFVGAPLLYLLGSVVLVFNGRTMIRNEGLSLSHLLAPIVGGIPVLIVFALIALALVGFVGGEGPTAIGAVMFTGAVAVYGYLLWIAWCTIPYGVLYTLTRKTSNPEFIIIHGSGLIDGNVPPLLASRLDKAIEVYNAGGGRATLIPSGGQGDDEPRPEAWAMAEYLMSKGIPADKIVPEDQSTTTYENLRNSKLIIEKRSEYPGQVIFVTSNYHVFRTALIARKVGLKAHGIGSSTARYYLPSAIIREFIAITAMYKWWHIIPVAFGVVMFFTLYLLSAVL